MRQHSRTTPISWRRLRMDGRYAIGTPHPWGEYRLWWADAAKRGVNNAWSARVLVRDFRRAYIFTGEEALDLGRLKPHLKWYWVGTEIDLANREDGT